MTSLSPISPVTRRNFLKSLSAVGISGGLFLESLHAQDAKFVIAETAFGKIRGVDNDGIKIFKGIPYGAEHSRREPLHASPAGTRRLERRARCSCVWA